MASGNSDDYCIEESEEAKYNFSDGKGLWQPKPEDILSLFEQLAGGGVLPLKWQCPGRRSPRSQEVVAEESAADGASVQQDEEKEEKPVAPEASAFDFDEFPSEANTKLTPIRAPGGTGRTPRTKKRARMDNIMNSLMKEHLKTMAEKEARRARGSPSGTPKSRLFGKKGTPAVTPRPVASPAAAASPILTAVSTASAPAIVSTETESVILQPNSKPAASTAFDSISTSSSVFATATITPATDTLQKSAVSDSDVTKTEGTLLTSASNNTAESVVSTSAAQTSTLGAPLPSVPQVPKTLPEVTSVPPANQSSATLIQVASVSNPSATVSISSPSITPDVDAPQKSQIETQPSTSTEKPQPITPSTAVFSSEPVTSTIASTCTKSSPALITVSAVETAPSVESAQSAPIQTMSTIGSSESIASPPVLASTIIKPTSAVTMTSSSTLAISTTVESTMASLANPEPSVSPPSLPPPYSVPLPTASNTISSPISTSAPLAGEAAVENIPVPLAAKASKPPSLEEKPFLSSSSPAGVMATASKSETSETQVNISPTEASLSETDTKDTVESEIKSLSLAEKS